MYISLSRQGYIDTIDHRLLLVIILVRTLERYGVRGGEILAFKLANNLVKRTPDKVE